MQTHKVIVKQHES